MSDPKPAPTPSKTKNHPATPARASTPPGQTHIVRAIVVSAVACGAWFGAVRPLELKLESKRSELQDAKAQLAAFEAGLAQEQPLDKAISTLTAQAQMINDWTACSGDTTRLYESFRALAARGKVRIERIEPSAASRTSRSTGVKGQQGAPETLGYTVEVTGKYEAITRFMDSIEQDLGVSKIVSFHMSPAGNGAAASSADPQITAIIETSHLKLSIPNVTPAAAKDQKDPSRKEKGA